MVEACHFQAERLAPCPCAHFQRIELAHIAFLLVDRRGFLAAGAAISASTSVTGSTIDALQVGEEVGRGSREVAEADPRPIKMAPR